MEEDINFEVNIKERKYGQYVFKAAGTNVGVHRLG